MDGRFGRVLDVLRERDVSPVAFDVSRLDSHNRRLAEAENADRRRRARVGIDDPAFGRLGLSRADWRCLEDEGLVQVISEVETVYPDPESGVPVERRVELVRLTESGRSTIGYEGRRAA
jgi:hypothetical protein